MPVGVRRRFWHILTDLPAKKAFIYFLSIHFFITFAVQKNFLLWQEYVRLLGKYRLPEIWYHIPTLRQKEDFYPIFRKKDISLRKKTNGLP